MSHPKTKGQKSGEKTLEIDPVTINLINLRCENTEKDFKDLKNYDIEDIVKLVAIQTWRDISNKPQGAIGNSDTYKSFCVPPKKAKEGEEPDNIL